MEKEAKHLLAGEGDLQEEYPFANSLRYRRRSRLSNVPRLALLCSFLFTIFFMSLAILLLKTILGYEIVIRPHGLAKHADLMMYSPLHYPLQYETKVTSPQGWDTSLYFGEPSEESERAWNMLIQPTGMRLSPPEAKRVGLDDNVVMPDGDIISVPAVMHNLHCLRRMRQTLQAGHYQRNFSEGELKEDKYHSRKQTIIELELEPAAERATVHCLESIRHSIMCRADLTPLQFWWDNDAEFHALKVKVVGAQTCLNWDSFETVRESRTYDRAELQHYHDQGY